MSYTHCPSCLKNVKSSFVRSSFDIISNVFSPEGAEAGTGPSSLQLAQLGLFYGVDDPGCCATGSSAAASLPEAIDSDNAQAILIMFVLPSFLSMYSLLDIPSPRKAFQHLPSCYIVSSSVHRNDFQGTLCGLQGRYQ